MWTSLGGEWIQEEQSRSGKTSRNNTNLIQTMAVSMDISSSGSSAGPEVISLSKLIEMCT